MWRDDHIYLGTAYYPEHWPQDRWATDVALMRAAGLEVVRVAELAWAVLEPQPATWCFDWLDEFLAIAARHGLSVILGTPTEAPPSWLWHQYPDVVATDEWGRPHGGRGRYCYNNRRLQEHINALVSAMAERYGHDPRVIGWQIDNELRATRCFCQQCQRDFRGWLKARYGSLDTLNEAWGTVFWSQRYARWEDVDLPTGAQLTTTTSQILDHLRFASESAVRHLERQASIIRQHSREQFVTHNSMGVYPWLDLHALARSLDFIGWDSYPAVDSDNFDTVLAHDLMRSVKSGTPFWMLEQKNGYFNGSAYNLAIEPGLVRLWAYQDIARGANGILFYRWRSNRFNVEQNPNGILRHDGEPRRAYQEIAQLSRELSRFGDQLAMTRVEAQAAIIWSYDQVWAESAHPQYPAIRYADEVAAYHRALTQLGFTADVVSPMADLSQYRWVVAPMLSLVNPDMLARLADFVSAGGHLVLSVRSGIKSWSNVVFDVTWPEPLGTMVGVRVAEFDAPPPGVENGIIYDHQRYAVGGWLEILEPLTAEVLATYDGKFYKGAAAVTRNQYGNGWVTYVGVRHQDDLLRAVFAEVTETAGLELPPRVFYTTREGKAGRFAFYLNFQPVATAVKVRYPGRDLLTRQWVQGQDTVGAWDLLLIEEDRSDC